MADRAIGRHAIGPGQHARRPGRARWRRACAHRRPGRGRTRRRCRGCGLRHRPRRGCGGSCWREWLAAIRCSRRSSIHFTGRPKPQRGGADQDVLGIKLAADAEAAADMALVEMHPRRRQPEHAGDLIAIPVRHLGRAVQLEHLARAVIARRWRRASPAARRNGGRRAARARRSHGHCGTPHRGRHIPCGHRPPRSNGPARIRRARHRRAAATGSSSISSTIRSAASSAR